MQTDKLLSYCKRSTYNIPKQGNLLFVIFFMLKGDWFVSK